MQGVPLEVVSPVHGIVLRLLLPVLERWRFIIEVILHYHANYAEDGSSNTWNCLYHELAYLL